MERALEEGADKAGFKVVAAGRAVTRAPMPPAWWWRWRGGVSEPREVVRRAGWRGVVMGEGGEARAREGKGQPLQGSG